jgi:hypothetical protein
VDLSKSVPSAKNGTLAAILLTRGLLLLSLGATHSVRYSDGPDAIIQDSYWHRWARLLKQQTWIIADRLPTNENKQSVYVFVLQKTREVCRLFTKKQTEVIRLQTD